MVLKDEVLPYLKEKQKIAVLKIEKRNDHRIIRGVEFTRVPELLPLTCVITVRVGELRSNVYFQAF